jgi:hypothetical protein
LAIGELREEAPAGEAAALLRAAIRRIRACLEGGGAPPPAAGAAVAVRPFYLGPARGAGRIDEPEPPFHPFLAGMEIRVSAAAAGTGIGAAAETAAAAACYNLGLAHHLAGLRRASRDRSDQEQEGGGPGPKAGSRLRKALAFYRLAGAALGAEGDGEGGGADSNASSSSSDDGGCLLLRAAILANTGHARLLLRGEGRDGEDAGRHVRACADGLAGLLRDPARAGRLARLVLQGREDADDEDQDEDQGEDELEGEAGADESADPPLTRSSAAAGGALLLSLELNVLLHSEAGRPAPCA